MKVYSPIKSPLIRGLAVLFLIGIPAWAGTQDQGKLVEQPPPKTTEPWIITVDGPGWLAAVTGHVGFHGVNPYVSVGVKQIIDHLNAIFALGGEVRRGRFGVLGDILYLNAQAGQATSGLVSKVDLGLQQVIGELFASYRVIEGRCGWLDLLGGFRYTYLGQQVGLQADNVAINVASTQLVNQFAQQLVTDGSNSQALIQKNIVSQLGALDGHNPTIPVGPVAVGQKQVIANLVQQQVQSQEPALAAAIQAGDQAKVNQLKSQLSNQIARTLSNQLNRSFSFYDDWFDPAIGLRGRFYLNKAFYLTAESDVGGFGIGSDIAVQAYAAFATGIFTMTSATATSFISWHSTVHSSRPGSPFRSCESGCFGRLTPPPHLVMLCGVGSSCDRTLSHDHHEAGSGDRQHLDSHPRRWRKRRRSALRN